MSHDCVVLVLFFLPLIQPHHSHSHSHHSLTLSHTHTCQSNHKISSASICIIGGGVAGLTAAITAAEKLSDTNNNDSTTTTTTTTKIILLEASPTFGGRVQSDVTDDGYILDRGFAVFIEEYPTSRAMLDYEQLELGKFLPGAMVKLLLPDGDKGGGGMAKVADPLRQPLELWTALTAPVGTLLDKLKVLPLIFHVVTSDADALFREEETTTLQALQERWGFSEEMISKFYKPFLEGIYLAPLDEQSSRMFSFIFKMFSQGSATLPRNGIGAVSQQLVERAKKAGVVVQSDCPVGSISVLQNDSDEDGRFVVNSVDGTRRVLCDSVIVATDVSVAESLLSQVVGVESTTPPQPQRSVGCLYYGFDGDAPIQEPILILSGLGDKRGTEQFPINNVCFPSVVNPSYAPPNKSLCCVTVLKPAMELYEGREDDLDMAVRRQLHTWFPECNTRKSSSWRLLNMYSIPNAQPAQLGGPVAANVYGGRDAHVIRGTTLPTGMYVCGDHMATATLNGALESGVNAGKAAAATVAATARVVAVSAE